MVHCASGLMHPTLASKDYIRLTDDSCSIQDASEFGGSRCFELSPYRLFARYQSLRLFRRRALRARIGAHPATVIKAIATSPAVFRMPISFATLSEASLTEYGNRKRSAFIVRELVRYLKDPSSGRLPLDQERVDADHDP